MPDMIQHLDDTILLYLLEHLHTEFLDKYMVFITSLGNSGIIWIAITFLLLLNKKTRPCGIVLAIALSLEFTICDGILKNVFKRPRPFEHFDEVKMLVKKPRSYSFPSGHTMSSFTAATVIFSFYKKQSIAAFLLAAMIGFSRIYLFCHYPSDVVTGAVLGIAIGLSVVNVILIVRKKMIIFSN